MQQFGIKIHTLYVFTMPMFQEFMKPPKKKEMIHQKKNDIEVDWKNFRNEEKNMECWSDLEYGI